MATAQQSASPEYEIGGFRLNLVQEIGRGGFGTVYKGYNIDGRIAAVKKVSKRDRKKAASEAVRFHYLKETIIHPNVVTVFDVKTGDDAMWIIMEYCDLGDLNDFHKHYGDTALRDIKSKVVIMRQIATGVAFLHSKDIVHRDIKPANVLLTLSPQRHAVVKLGDFGLSKILDPDASTSTMSSNVGTIQFQAPEFWDKQPPYYRIRYHRVVDVYSMGLTFAAMLQAKSGRKLVPREEATTATVGSIRTPIGLLALNRVQNGAPPVNVVQDKTSDDDITRRIKNIIREMTQAEPQKRLSAELVCSALPNLVCTKHCRLHKALSLR